MLRTLILDGSRRLPLLDGPSGPLRALISGISHVTELNLDGGTPCAFVDKPHVVRYVATAAAGAYGGLYLLGRRAGSTLPERRESLPGDDLVTRPNVGTDHAVTIDAAPAAVWPWLTQLGWHLGGYY